MALTLTDIHKSLSDFFVTRFGQSVSDSVMFRFDRFGSVIAESDFVDRNHPEAGPVPALAREVFSDLVNRVPKDAGDGSSIVLTQYSVDETYYYRLLSPAVPVAPEGSDDTTRQAIIDAFVRMQAHGQDLWNKVKLESLSGLMLDYKPSLASPSQWYDGSSHEAWATTTLTLAASSDTPAPTEPPDQTDPSVQSMQLWRLPVDEQVVSRALEERVTAPSSFAVTAEPSRMSAIRAALFAPAASEVAAAPDAVAVAAAPQALLARRASSVSRAALQPSALTSVLSTTEVEGADSAVSAALTAVTDEPTADSVREPVGDLSSRVQALDLQDRLVYNDVIVATAPTAPVVTTSLSVTFDYCLVQIDRPWWLNALVDDHNWKVPGDQRGEVTDATALGGMPLLSVGLVVVRNLTISAQWSDTDRENAARADRLGPFKVDGMAADGSLGHSGIQAIGWMLAPLPPLPPVGDGPQPSPGPSPAPAP